MTEDPSIIRFQVSVRDRERIKRLMDRTETATMSQVIRDALKVYEHSILMDAVAKL